MGLTEIIFIVSTLSHFQYQGFKGVARYMGEPERPLKFVSFISRLLRLFFSSPLLIILTNYLAPFSEGCTLLRLFLEHPCVQYWQFKAPENPHKHTQIFLGLSLCPCSPSQEGLWSFLQAPGEPRERFKPMHILSHLSSEFKLNIYRAQQDLH